MAVGQGVTNGVRRAQKGRRTGASGQNEGRSGDPREARGIEGIMLIDSQLPGNRGSQRDPRRPRREPAHGLEFVLSHLDDVAEEQHQRLLVGAAIHERLEPVGEAVGVEPHTHRYRGLVQDQATDAGGEERRLQRADSTVRMTRQAGSSRASTTAAMSSASRELEYRAPSPLPPRPLRSTATTVKWRSNRGATPAHRPCVAVVP
jgi:hypothetical protein